jgi:hypothetical protein
VRVPMTASGTALLRYFICYPPCLAMYGREHWPRMLVRRHEAKSFVQNMERFYTSRQAARGASSGSRSRGVRRPRSFLHRQFPRGTSRGPGLLWLGGAGGVRHCIPVRLSRAGFSLQFGRASAPTMPQLVQTMRGPNAGTGTWSGPPSAPPGGGKASTTRIVTSRRSRACCRGSLARGDSASVA